MTSLSLRLKVDGDLKAMMTSEVKAAERAVQTGIRGATQSLKENWREQVRGANLGGRLANTIRGIVYTNSGSNVAGLVYAKAPKIIGAHDKGELIRSRGAVWMAIPLSAAGKGPGGKKRTPAEWEKHFGRQLKYVHRKGRAPMLVDVGKVITRGLMSRMSRKGFHTTFTPRGFSNRSVPMFILVPFVRLKDKLDLMPAAERIAATVPGRIIAAWRD